MTHELPYSGLAYEIGSYDPDELNFESASGSIASFDNGAEDVPLKSLKVNIVPKQSGSGDPSPDNIRPITGWDEVEVVRCGTNCFDSKSWVLLGSNRNYYTVSDDGKITVTGNDLSGIGNRLIKVKSGAEYRIITNGITASVFNSNSSNISSEGRFTAPVDGLIAVKFYASSYPTTGWAMIVPYDATIPTTYEPYQGTSYPIPLPSTVYGGTLNVTTGEGIDTHIKNTFDGTENWTMTSDGKSFYLSPVRINPPMKQGTWTNDPLTMCDKFKKADSGEGVIRFGANDGGIYLYNIVGYVDGVTDLASWKSWLATNKLNVTYPLATPTDFTATPVEITTLLGNNNIWSSSGNIDVEFIPMVEKNTFPYSGEKYYVGIFEEVEPVGMVRPIDITPISIDEPIISPIDLNEPIDLQPLPIDEPIEDIEEEETDTEESETDGECESELND